jgi:hypothetical protein
MEIELNGARLKVYEDGTIETKQLTKHGTWTKNWKKVKGAITNKYKRHSINSKRYMTARIIGYAYLGLDINDTTQEIDHIDRNSLNNNLSNLRIVTREKNMWNRNPKGYSFHKFSKKWFACINVNHNRIDLGYYDTEEEARQAYLEAKIKYHIL